MADLNKFATGYSRDHSATAVLHNFAKYIDGCRKRSANDERKTKV